MIKFLVGRTGCGKTYTVMNEIQSLPLDTYEKVFLFVPEQQLYSAEHSLFSKIPADKRENLFVLSFTKLCDVIEDTFGGRSQSKISKATSALLMWQNLRQ